MGKNDFLARRAAREQECFNAGARMGRQQMCDFITLALRDPDTMGKDTFSGKRIVRVMQRVNRLLDEFYPAFEQGPEADYYQEMLDKQLREAYGEEIREGFFGFHERYEIFKKFDYQSGRWK